MFIEIKTAIEKKSMIWFVQSSFCDTMRRKNSQHGRLEVCNSLQITFKVFATRKLIACSVVYLQVCACS